MNNEVQKPDDATLILKRMLKAPLITVEFLKRGEMTEFVLTHSRFATVESRDNHAQGWSKIAESFARFVEKE